MRDNWFKRTIDERDIDLAELAEVLDMAVKTLKEYYSGRRKPGRDTKVNLMKILDLTEEDINDTH